MKRHGTEISSFCYLGTTEAEGAGQKPGLGMVVFWLGWATTQDGCIHTNGVPSAGREHLASASHHSLSSVGKQGTSMFA